VPLSPGPRQGRDHGGLEGVEIGRSEVREIAVLGVAPDLLGRVEVRRVGREPLDDDPPIPGQPALDARRPVRAAPVPDERETARQVAMQRLEEPQDLGGSDVVGSRGGAIHEQGGGEEQGRERSLRGLLLLWW